VVAFVASGRLAVIAVTYYLVAYFVTSLGAFGVVSYLSTADRDADDLEDYRGLAWRRPGVAAVMTAMLLSLAGIPLTAGFIGKFYVLTAGVNAGLWVLAAVLVIGSTIGLFYYLRLVAMMYRPAAAAPAAGRWAALACAALVATVIAMLMLGVYPSPLIQAIQALVVDVL
jgi:NADH-quinone oxidoreductase subunit N